MNVPLVCATCFRQLLRPSRHLRNASFVSLGTLVNRDDGDQAQIQQETASADIEEPTVKASTDMRRKTYAQQYEEQRRPKGMDKVLETLFSSNRAQEHASQVSRYSRTPKIHRVEEVVETRVKKSLTDLRLLELHNLLRRGTSGLQYIWESCLELFNDKDWWTERRLNGVGKNRHDAFFYDLLMAVCAQQPLSVDSRSWTPAAVIEMFLKKGVMRSWWHRVIWSQLKQLMELRHQNAKKTPEAIEKAETQIEDLLKVWSLFTRRHSTVGYHVKIVDEGSRASSDESLETRFQRLARNYSDTRYTSSLAAAGITTVEYLGMERIESSALVGRKSLQLLTRFLSELGRGINTYLTVTQDWLNEVGTSAEVVDLVIKRLNPRHVKDKHDMPVWKRDELGERKPKKTYDWDKVARTQRLGEVDTALRHADPEDTVNLWENFVEYLEGGKPKHKETNSEIYAKFLSAFWSLRCSKEALLVWNYMVNSGQLPAQIHWNAMLSGCAAARDAKSMQDIWRNMLRSKVEPDIQTWTTYIHSLIKLWKWEEGLKALQSLGRTWEGKPATGALANDGKPMKQNNIGRFNASVPHIAPVHGALSALTAIKKPELHATVIAWAESHNIPLETYTFNILLQPIVRHGTQAQIQSHLSKMAAHNCPPDIITFTIILQGLVSNRDSTFHALSPTDQENTIMTILHDMEAQKISADAHTYTILLDALLSPKSWKTDPHLLDASHPTTDASSKQIYNVPAARTILRHMQSRNLIPAPHHYVILVNHYFSRTPPDLAAVGTLWHGIRHGGQTQKLDDLFYDRMIQGYADHDEIEKALEFLRMVPDEGKKPSWWALYRVLAALDRGREWDLCRELMEDVEDPRGLFRHGQGMFRGKRQFYELVDSLRGNGVLMGGSEQI